MRRITALLLTLAGLFLSAGAETAPGALYPPAAAVVVPGNGAVYTLTQSLIRVSCAARGPVRLRITGPGDRLVYESLGQAEGELYRSETIHLPLREGRTVYEVSLTDDDGLRAATVIRVPPVLENVRAWAGAFPFSAVTGRETRARIALMSGQEGIRRFPLVLEGWYTLGEALCTVADGCLTVSLGELPESARLLGADLRVAFTADALPELPRGGPGALEGALDQPIPLEGRETVALWLRLRVTVDPADLPPAPAAPDPEQLLLWQQFQDNSEAGGTVGRVSPGCVCKVERRMKNAERRMDTGPGTPIPPAPFPSGRGFFWCGPAARARLWVGQRVVFVRCAGGGDLIHHPLRGRSPFP